MKILTLISGGDVGGAKTHVLGLLRELGKRIDVKLVCFMEAEFTQAARDMGIDITILDSRDLRAVLAELRRRGASTSSTATAAGATSWPGC